MEIQKLVEEYQECVNICSRIDYSDKNTIKDNNKAVKRMYSILKNIKENNIDDIKYFYHLLDNELTGKWFSHQLLELFEVDITIEKKAIKIIKKLSKKEYGNRIWLENYKRDKKTNELVDKNKK